MPSQFSIGLEELLKDQPKFPDDKRVRVLSIGCGKVEAIAVECQALAQHLIW